MIDYGKPSSNQMQLPGLDAAGEQTMLEARTWVKEHPEEFDFFKQHALIDSFNGYASAKFLIESMRRRYKVSIKNAFAPCLARIAMEQDPRIHFKTAKSRVDGFTTARLS